jgi:ketosteroid isomerase-like protein
VTTIARPPKTNPFGLRVCLSAFISEETMTLNPDTKKALRSTSLLLVLFVSLFYNPISSRALASTAALPAFSDFSKSVQNSDGKALRGVYVDDVLALPIIQQPSGNPAYVSNSDGEITQFGMASQYGNVGLLAHNNLAGKSFSGLAAGQQVRLVYGDGKTETFVITEILRYQALQPASPYSSFRNLDKNKETLTAEQMFKRAYLGNRHVTFQTCIEAYGNPSWGRLFVIAVPKTD